MAGAGSSMHQGRVRLARSHDPHQWVSGGGDTLADTLADDRGHVVPEYEYDDADVHMREYRMGNSSSGSNNSTGRNVVGSFPAGMSMSALIKHECL